MPRRPHAVSTVLLQALEQRRHLSASLSGDKLVIETGAGNDTVELTLGGNGATIDVQENGGLQSFSTAAVKSIEISTGAGNDRVTLSNQVIVFTKPVPKQIKLPAAVIIGGLGNDTIQGGPSNDTIFGDNKPVVILPPISGGVRAMVLPGLRDLEGGGNDVLDGGNGNDTMNGGSGDDTLLSGPAGNGADRFSGGSGKDTLDFFARTSGVVIRLDGTSQSGATGEGDAVVGDFEVIFGTNHDDQIFGSPRAEFIDPMGGNNRVEAGAGDDTIRCDNGGISPGNDTVFGGDGNDAIISNGGTDVLHGDDGNDVLGSGPGTDQIFGGAGIDRVVYSGRTAGVEIHLDGVAHSGAAGENDLLGGDIERAVGTEHDDTIFGNELDNSLDGNGGRDTISGGAGNDRLTARDASELNGDTGNDTIDGSESNDTIHGNQGNDILRGHGGNDQIGGEEGNDRIDGGTGSDLLVGDEGTDTLNYSSRSDNLTIRLNGQPTSGSADEKDTIAPSFEVIYTGSGNDVIFGTERADRIFAGAGNDEVRGLGGNDHIDGGDGNDRLIGGDGNDRLIGRAGKDTIYGQNGSDIIYADDNAFDYLFGGAGRDRFRADAVDRLSEVERRL